jgi:hypothetical protein
VRRESESRVLDGPRETGVVVESVPRGTEISVYGQHGGFLFVRTAADRAGWLESDAR